MAGPGGGPPRRSHTKSRKGCETCKKRHIRCDESFPQCKNCTKHKIRCPYNDIPVQDSARPNGPPNLLWTPEVELTIEHWQSTGIFPVPGLDIHPPPNPQNYTLEELRLIHHVASISHELGDWDANSFTLWTQQIPSIIGIGSSHRFVMDALLAYSAEHISNITGCPNAGKLAFEHRGRALAGLRTSLSTILQDNSDALLAASLVLSWQAPDWRSWTQHMQGTRGVINQMDSWPRKSQFGVFITETTTFLTAPPSPSPEHKPRLPNEEDEEAVTRTLQHLQKLETHLKQNREDTKLVAQLISFLKGCRKVDPTMSVADLFERLKPLREWLFWLPVMHLRQTRGAPNALVVIAFYYTVAILMERMFPAIGAAYFGQLAIGPLEEIDQRLVSLSVYDSEAYPDTIRQLMSFSRDTIREFRTRMGWYTPAPSPFNGHDFGMPMSAPVQEGLPYCGTPIFSYSTENLSVTTDSSAPGTGGSPVTMPSPYPNQQYLKIPPPVSGCYSPASSTCEASSIGDDFTNYEHSPIFYSDNEDSGRYNTGFPGPDVRLSLSGPGSSEDLNRGFEQCSLGYTSVHSPMGAPLEFGMPSPYLSTTPTFPPPDFHKFHHSHSPAGSISATAASPFLAPQSFPMSIPDSPLAPSPHHLSSHGHRHNHSTASAPPSFYHPNDCKFPAS